MKICVIGLGYIGLPTAAMFATHGYQVVGVDVNQLVIDQLNLGKITIEEKSLDEFVSNAVKSGNLKGAIVPETADVFIIAVPTPITSDKKADMSYVEKATESIVPYLTKGNMVILESTSPVGTVDELMVPILAKSGLNVETDLYVGHSPERVIPGMILKELVENDRIVGGINHISSEKIKELYTSFVKGAITLTNARTAEMCKLTENTFRDVNIALANELAKICEVQNINVWELIELCNKHPRVNIHQPGPGVGGHCIAVDPWFIVEKQPELSNIIALSRKTNDSMPHHVFSLIKKILKLDKNILPENCGNGHKITIFGATYKPNVDDLRESPLLELVEILKAHGFEVGLYDPHVLNNPKFNPTMEEAVLNSDMLVLGVDHQAFKNLPVAELANKMRKKNLLDTRNMIDSNQCKSAGFNYFLLGNELDI